MMVWSVCVCAVSLDPRPIFLPINAQTKIGLVLSVLEFKLFKTAFIVKNQVISRVFHPRCLICRPQHAIKR